MTQFDFWQKAFLAAIAGLCADPDIGDVVSVATKIADQATAVYAQRSRTGVEEVPK